MVHSKEVLQALKHAAEKEAIVAVLKKAIGREENAHELLKLSRECAREMEKRSYRVARAQNIVGAGVFVRLFDLQGIQVAEGVLSSLDLKKGKLGIKQVGSSQAPELHTFVKVTPVPKDLAENGQLFYGMELLLNLKLYSVSRDQERMLR